MRLISYFTALLLLAGTFANAQDYCLYHKNIIDAERQIFVAKDITKGLNLFKTTFSNYSFVYVDDCIEAFQLALYFKREDLAMLFIKKALANGFELQLLDKLNMGCACNLYRDRREVTIHKDFIARYRDSLNAYSASAYSAYIARIDKALLQEIIKRHVKEQTFKNYPTAASLDIKVEEREYIRITEDNLRYMDSLAMAGVYVGERNLGIYTNRQAIALHLSFGSIERYGNSLLHFYNLPATYNIPYNTEYDYFDASPVYVMQFHNPKSFSHLTRYKDAAIKAGYLHPREYATLQFHSNGIKDTLLLFPSTKMATETKSINNRRRELLLPDYETDFYKHAFAHEHNLKLNFGFLCETR